MSEITEQQEPKLYAHVDPIKDYVGRWFILLILLVVTVLAAIPDLGALAVPIAMGIAVVKALLVIWVFMGFRHATKLTQVWAAIALIFLFTMFVLFLGDYWSGKDRLVGPEGWEPTHSTER